jgi:hypothetical protein
MTLQTFARLRPRPSACGGSPAQRGEGAKPPCLRTCVPAWLGFRAPDSPRTERLLARSTARGQAFRSHADALEAARA